MKNPLPILSRILQVGYIALALPAAAQVPNTLLQSISNPVVGVQSKANLGFSVVVEGTYVVVGAPFDGTGGTSAGVVKVFDSTSGALLHVLTSPDPLAGRNFGRSLGLSGTRLVVGAVEAGTSVNTTNSYGQVYVYDLSNGTPTIPVVTLTSPIPIPSFKSGWSVAISGMRVVVGAYWAELFGCDQGRAYVYDLSGPAPATPVATFSNPSSVAGDNFARSVAVSGTRVAVAVPLFDAGVSLTDVWAVCMFMTSTAQRQPCPRRL